SAAGRLCVANRSLESAVAPFERDPPPLLRIVEGDLRRVEGVRVERAARPRQHLCMPGVPSIPDHLKKLRIPRRAPYVLGRAGSCTGDTSRIGTSVRGKPFFELDRVLPTVAEVIEVAHRPRAVRQISADRNLPTS